MKRMIIIVLSFVSFMINAMGQNVEWAIYDCPDAEEFHSGLATFQDETTGKWGAINTSGEIAISPKYDERLDFTGGCSIVKLGDDYGIMGANLQMILDTKYLEISRDDKYEDYFYVKDKNGKCGIFNNYQFIVPCTYDIALINEYPFAILSIKNGETKTINLLNGRVYWFVLYYGESKCFSVTTHEGTTEYFSDDNFDKALSEMEMRTHHSGAILYKGDNGWGVKKDNKVLIEPIYSCYTPMWSGNLLRLSKKDNTDQTWHYIFDCKGKEIVKFKESDNTLYSPITKDIIQITSKTDGGTCYGLMDSKGKVLLQPINKYLSHIRDNWFEVSSTNEGRFVYNSLTQKKYIGSITFKLGNILTLHDNSKWGYLNTKTGNYTGLIYDYCAEFKDGVGVVCKSFGDDDILLDENFKIIMSSTGSNVKFYGYNGEGVIKASKYLGYSSNGSSYVYGYIYNPLGHGNYVYNNANAQKIRCKDMFDRGLALFNKQKYVKAKDLFYQVMVLEPNNYKAIENYAVCLNNMGYYDEAIQAHRMALDVNPNYELAAENLEISLNNKNRPVQTTNSGTFWDALATFGKLAGQLGQTFSSMKGFDTSQTYFDSEGGYSSSEAEENEDPATKGMSREAKANHYTQKYYSLESKVKNIYNSITSHRSTTKDGKKQGVNTKTSVTDRGGDSDKKMMARYQTQMRQCRKMANYYGGHVAKSKYEDAKSSTLYL